MEIERKFLVEGEFRPYAIKKLRITQGYISSNPERTVRIRKKGDRAYITIKGAGSPSGATRYEWEKEISLKEAEELFKICEPGIIDKIRHLVPVGAHTFEVDEFLGKNQGLILTEVELQSEDEIFEKPPWLGREVTGDIRYYNSMLVKNPLRSGSIS
jgi:adenylate cyclase